MKVGDKVKDIYLGFVGVVLEVWGGRYTASYCDGEQYNPWRITVRFGQDYIKKYGGGVGLNGTVMKKIEHLEVLETQPSPRKGGDDGTLSAC